MSISVKNVGGGRKSPFCPGGGGQNPSQYEPQAFKI